MLSNQGPQGEESAVPAQSTKPPVSVETIDAEPAEPTPVSTEVVQGVRRVILSEGAKSGDSDEPLFFAEREAPAQAEEFAGAIAGMPGFTPAHLPKAGITSSEFDRIMSEPDELLEPDAPKHHASAAQLSKPEDAEGAAVHERRKKPKFVNNTRRYGKGGLYDRKRCH